MFEQLKADIKKSLESKKENDPQRLLKLLKDNPNQFLTIKEWSEIFKKPIASTRRNLAGLEDNDIITRIGKKGKKGVKYGFEDDINWHKKLLKTGQTKDPKKNTKAYIEIYTFENNDENRYQSLLNAAFNGLLGTLDSIDEAGYSSEQVSATDVETLYVTDFSMDNPDGSWAFLKVDEWANKTDTGRVELYEA